MTITAIGDAVRAFIQSFQVSTIFPAGLFVFINAYIVLPIVSPDPDRDLTSVVAITLIVSLTLMLSYTLYTFNYPLIRLFEGYKLANWDVSRWLKYGKEEKLRGLLRGIDDVGRQQWEMIKELGYNPDDKGVAGMTSEQRLRWQYLTSEQSSLERDFDERFPETIDDVLPTDLGNIIAAFEAYPGNRYGMDAPALWPRLVPVLREAKYTDFVNQEKSVFDFLLNTLVISAILGTELLWIGLYEQTWLLALVGLGGILVLPILYNGLLVAGRQWGTTVRVAFDLYRHDLRQQLGVAPSQDFKEEFQRWQRVSSFIEFRQESEPGPDFSDFISSTNWDKQKS